MVKKNALGRGLDALLSMDDIKTEGSSSINEVSLSRIVPNPDQPRREFDEDGLSELATSISTIGVIQPITLRELSDGTYQIIAGERRFRAAKQAGLENIPAYIRKAQDDLVMEMALIENIQREDLNAVEIALAFQKLLEIYNLTQDKLSDRLGKKRTTIANYLRLLKLPAEIQLGLTNKKIDMGHAKALISINDPTVQLSLYEEIVAEGYSVRKVEELVKHLNATTKEHSTVSTKKVKPRTSEEFESLQTLLSKQLSANVRLKINQKGKGIISIPFESEEALEKILSIFDKLMH